MDRPLRQEQLPASDEVTEVAPGILRMQLPITMPGLGHVNCYAIEDARGFALVDPGLPGDESWAALVAKMGAAGVRRERVHTVIVTHSHPDHFGGAPRLAKESGADILTHRSFRVAWAPAEADGPEADGLAGGDPTGNAPEVRAPYEVVVPWGGSVFKPMGDTDQDRIRAEMKDRAAFPTPTRKVDDADVVSFANRDWVAIHTPGHTIDHLVLFDPAEGVVLSGDHVLPTITPHIGVMGNSEDPLSALFASLAKMAELEGVSTVLPAHGDPFVDLAGRAQAIHQHHLERLGRLVKAFEELGRPASVPELMKYLFSERAWGSMAESETFAHLEHLRLNGEVTSQWQDGLLCFSPADHAGATGHASAIDVPRRS